MGWTCIKTSRPLIEVFKEKYRSWMKPTDGLFIYEFVEKKVPKSLMDIYSDEESEIFSAIFDPDEKAIYCHVVLAKRIKGEVLLKGMDEFSGPYVHNKVPKSIKNRLSDLSAFKEIGYAKQFRERAF